MTEELQRALAPLAERAPDPPPVEVVERRARARRRRFEGLVAAVVAVTAVVVAAAVGAGAGHGPSGGDHGEIVVTESSTARPAPITVVHIDDAKPAIRAARLVRPLSLDGGALRLDPAAGDPSLTEAQAIAKYRGSALLGSTVGDVVVVYARITLALKVTNETGVSPGRTPAFDARDAWVVFAATDLFGSCPAQTVPEGPTSTTVAVPQSFSVFLLSGDGTEGVTYSTRGRSRCFATLTGPSASIASVAVSVPWTLGGADGKTVQFTVPACSDGLPDAARAGDRTSTTLTLYLLVAVVREPCTSLRRGPNPPVTASPGTRHGPTGPVVAITTGGSTFTYFDGTTHTIR